MKTLNECPSFPLNGGIQHIAKFPNNYGASIVRHHFSYGNSSGLWELAVVKYDKDEQDIRNFDLCYRTPITQDVIGHLTEAEVNELLEKISALKEGETI